VALAARLPERHGPGARPQAALPANPDDTPERLAALLDEGNGDAVDLVRNAGAALTARLGPGLYLRVAQAVEAFDFDGALDLLRRHEPAAAD
jgi:hypothetical protein